MDRIHEQTEELIRCIRKSEIYQHYQETLAVLNQQPELKNRVDQFRGLMFRLHSEQSEIDLFEESDRINQEYQELQKVSVVNAYLEAELEVCRLIKAIEQRINEEIELSLP